EAVQYLQKDLGFEPTGSIDQNWKPTNPKVEQGLPKSPLACDADFNQDGVINVLDFLILLQGYFTQNLNVDLDQNQVVDIVDVYIFILLFGQEPECACNWQQEAYIKAPNPDINDRFGSAVHISNDTIVVGAPYEDSNVTWIINANSPVLDNSVTDSGAAYIFKRNGNTWAQEAYIKAPVNMTNFDQFGTKVSIDNDTIVVGAPYEDSGQTTIINAPYISWPIDNTSSNAGAAYVFKRTGNLWNHEAMLKAPLNTADMNDWFGASVSVQGDTIVVGAPYEDSNQSWIINGTFASSDNSVANAGAAYIFKRNGNTWAQEAFVKAPLNIPDTNELFGSTVSIDNDTVVIGAPFEDSNQYSIVGGTYASPDNNLQNSGAAYIFKRNGNTWAQEAFVKASNADTNDAFAYNMVAINNDTLLVSAGGEDSNLNSIINGTTASTDDSLTDSGAVYVYKRSGNAWAQEAFLKPSNPDIYDTFGMSLGIDGDYAVVGVPFERSNQTTITNGPTASSDNSASHSGAAYVFKRDGSNWSQNAYLKAVNADLYDAFGTSVSINQKTIVVGAIESSNQTTITNGSTASSDNSLSRSGAAYIYRCVQNSNPQIEEHVEKK
ncbi:MAG: FG-GAP repeat protein, partial [Bdellovibrionales bacterium]|nr:FG-GAP repeat protein [Bdellovibrionales bacterium]